MDCHRLLTKLISFTCRLFIATVKVILCLWFRASLIYINNCPRRRNTKQSVYYSASSRYVFRVSNTPIIRSTQNCNHSLRYWSYCLCSYLPPTWPSSRWREVTVEWICRIISRLLCVASRWTIINIVKVMFCKRYLLLSNTGRRCVLNIWPEVAIF